MAKIQYLDSVQASIRKLGKRKLEGLEAGLIGGGLLLIKASLPLCPVDSGNLRATWYVRSGDKQPQKGRKADTSRMGTNPSSKILPSVEVGYTADYAIYVHEDLEKRHGSDYNAWYGEEISEGKKSDRGPDQQAKFLEQPLRTERKPIRDFIAQSVRDA